MQKNPMLRLAVILIIACVTGNFAQSQTRRRAPTPQPTNNIPAQTSTPARKRPATVSMKSGDTVTGNFTLANGDSVRIEVEGTPRNIKLDDVVSIVFNDEGSAENTATTKKTVRLSPQAKTAARDALKALRKMAGATEIGINFQEYGSRVIDAKADVEEGLRQIPDGDLKTEISLAMDAYADAAKAWNEMIRYDFLMVKFEPGATFQKKYSIPVDTSIGDPIMRRNVVLSTIWQAARTHLERAESLLA
jgi:hypothetical protein